MRSKHLRNCVNEHRIFIPIAGVFLMIGCHTIIAYLATNNSDFEKISGYFSQKLRNASISKITYLMRSVSIDYVVYN